MQYGRLMAALTLVGAGLVFSTTAVEGQTPAWVGSWTLTHINGQALPAITETTTNCEEVVPSGTLTLEADGDWEFEYLERETCGTDVDDDHENEDGNFTAEGQRVVFSDDTKELDPNDLELDELGIGIVNGNELSVTLQDGRTVILFRR